MKVLVSNLPNILWRIKIGRVHYSKFVQVAGILVKNKTTCCCICHCDGHLWIGNIPYHSAGICTLQMVRSHITRPYALPIPKRHLIPIYNQLPPAVQFNIIKVTHTSAGGRCKNNTHIYVCRATSYIGCHRTQVHNIVPCCCCAKTINPYLVSIYKSRYCTSPVIFCICHRNHAINTVYHRTGMESKRLRKVPQ